MKQAFNFWKHLNPGRVRQTEEIEEDESSSEEDTKKYTKYFPKEGRKRNNPPTQILLRSVPTFSGTGERFNRWVPKLETAMNSQPMLLYYQPATVPDFRLPLDQQRHLMTKLNDLANRQQELERQLEELKINQHRREQP